MIKVIHQGLGPIGLETAKLVLDDIDLEIVGAVDIKKEYVGRDLGDLLGCGNLGIKVTDTPEDVLKKVGSDSDVVLVLATSSMLEEIKPSLEVAIKKGINVVSSAEELFYPEFEHPLESAALDELASKYKKSVIGTGVHPGGFNDTIPLCLYWYNGFISLNFMGNRRYEDTGNRRKKLRDKTGAGLTEEEFYKAETEGKVGHVGSQMSVAYLLKEIFGISKPEIRFARYPIITNKPVQLGNGEVIRAGCSLGLCEMTEGVVEGSVRIKNNTELYVGAPNENSTRIHGKTENDIHNLHVSYNDVVSGDKATGIILVDAIRHAVSGTPGLNKPRYLPDPDLLLKDRAKVLNRV